VSDIEFSKKEYQILTDHQFFDVKASITSKVLKLFSRIEERIRLELRATPFNLPERVSSTYGKISKGENYLNCPYIVLDLPRLFSKKDIFACRTIFWWGHYFSNAFIMGGLSYHRYLPRFLENTVELKKRDWYLCVYNSPWKLEYLPWNYIQFSTLSNEDIRSYLQKYSFIKIARIYSLEQYQNLDQETVNFISDLTHLIA